MTARVTPGTSALDIQAQYAAAQQNLAAALALRTGRGPGCGAAAPISGAANCESRRDQLTATLTGLCGDDDVEQLRSRLAELRSLPAFSDDVTIDGGAARAELLEAVAARAQAGVDCETHRKVAALAMKKLTEVSTQATRVQDKLATQRAELVAVADRLAEQRATVARRQDWPRPSDADTTAAHTAASRVAELSEQLAAAAPDAVAAELADAVEAAAALRERHDEIARTLHEIAAQLTVFGTEGRKGKLDAAEISANTPETSTIGSVAGPARCSCCAT